MLLARRSAIAGFGGQVSPIEPGPPGGPDRAHRRLSLRLKRAAPSWSDPHRHDRLVRDQPAEVFRDGGSGFRTGARRYAEVGRRLGAGGGVIAGDRPLALSQRKTRYPVGLAGLILGAGVGFEPTTFRL